MPPKRAACQLYLLAVLLSACCCVIMARDRSEKNDGPLLLESLRSVGDCIIQSSFSFVYPGSFPPKSENELKARCKSQAEAFKCVKEKLKGTMPLVRRGLVSYVSGRAKDNKKYCTNTAGEEARKFVEANRCVMEKRFGAFRDNDAFLMQTLVEVARRNFTEPAIELKHICCALHNFKSNYGSLVGAECSAHKPVIEELSQMVVSDELHLVCEDDDKLAKQCAKLEPLQFKRVPNYKPDAQLPTPALSIYLLTTIGEPNDPSLAN